jgi:hypothetical protein
VSLPGSELDGERCQAGRVAHAVVVRDRQHIFERLVLSLRRIAHEARDECAYLRLNCSRHPISLFIA